VQLLFAVFVGFVVRWYCNNINCYIGLRGVIVVTAWHYWSSSGRLIADMLVGSLSVNYYGPKLFTHVSVHK